MAKSKKSNSDQEQGLVPCAVYLPAETVEALDEYAQHEGRKRAQMIRRIIEQYLAANPLEALAAK